jgi:hypothetical protein
MSSLMDIVSWEERWGCELWAVAGVLTNAATREESKEDMGRRIEARGERQEARGKRREARGWRRAGGDKARQGREG